MDKKTINSFKYAKILSISLIVLLIFYFVLGSFKTIVYDRDFYSAEYQKLGVYEKYGQELVESTTTNLLSYIKDGAPLTGFFSEKDKAHMVDVKRLINNTFTFYWIVVVLIVILFFIYYKNNKDDFLGFVSKAFIKAGITMLTITLIAFLLSSQFSSIFIGFHKIFFDNDLWLLDPAKDNLVNLFPEQFFFDFTGNMMIGALGSAIALAILGFIAKYWIKKRKK